MGSCINNLLKIKSKQVSVGSQRSLELQYQEQIKSVSELELPAWAQHSKSQFFRLIRNWQSLSPGLVLEW